MPSSCSVADLARVPDHSIKCFYIDPPWPYPDGNIGNQGAAEKHYDLMTLDDLAALPIKRLAAEKAHCHLWATVAFHDAAYDLLRAWGFQDRGYMLWCKPQLGMGHYYRISHEPLLLGVKGALKFGDKSIMSWAPFYTRGLGHSVKPAPIRTMLERVSPGPRLELFARTVHKGWIPWGNQIEVSAFDTALADEWLA